MMKHTVPRSLNVGDTIAIVSPSARLNELFPWRIERAVGFLERQGFRTKIIYNANVPESPLSANIAARAEELHSAFLDPSISGIICCIGGSTANELLPALDPEIIRKNPKIFCGSSDTTLLHHFCYVNGLRTFYGPSIITQLGEWPQPLPFTWTEFIKTTTLTQPLGHIARSPEFTDEFCDWMVEPQSITEGNMRPRVMKPARGWRWLRPGKAEGEIWGGCLPSILQLMGTRWDVSYQDKIALIELPEGDLPNSGFSVERAIWNFNDLRLRGILDQIRGLVIGRPYLFSPQDEIEWESAIVRAIDGYDFPVLAGVDVGHTDPMLTIPLGARVSLDSSQDRWEVLEAGVYEEHSK